MRGCVQAQQPRRYAHALQGQGLVEHEGWLLIRRTWQVRTAVGRTDDGRTAFDAGPRVFAVVPRMNALVWEDLGCIGRM